jgi:hypothetical protein
MGPRSPYFARINTLSSLIPELTVDPPALPLPLTASSKPCTFFAASLCSTAAGGASATSEAARARTLRVHVQACVPLYHARHTLMHVIK